jgi:hypothetical protein
VNERANVVTQLGEVTGRRTTAAGPFVVSFSVDAIRVDPECDFPRASGPLNGHFIAVDMSITIDASVTEGMFLAAKNFAVVGPDGVTDTDVVGYGWQCMRDRLSEQLLQPGQYRGTVVLDTAQTSGGLIFTPHLGQDGGWEWPF